MKSLTLKMLCAFSFIFLNFSFTLPKAEKKITQTKLQVNNLMYPTSGINLVNTTGYTISDIVITGVDANGDYVFMEYTTPLPSGQSHQFDFVYGIQQIRINVTTTGSHEGPQYGIRIYNDLDDLILDALKQNSSFDYSFAVPETFENADQLRVELYN